MRLLVSLAAAALCVLASSVAVVQASGGSVDQSDTEQDFGIAFGTLNGDSDAESFVPSISGYLTRVKLVVGYGVPPGLGGPIEVSILSFSGGVPASPTLASQSVAAASLPLYAIPGSWTTVVFSHPAHLTAGTTYAIALASPTGYYTENIDTGDHYASGSVFVNNNGSGWTSPFPGIDFDFETIMGAAVASSDVTHAGYCSVAGNLVDGQAVALGTFLNLELGQPDVDANYTGAAPANYIEGKGITCDPPPSGYTRKGTYDGPGAADGIYPYYVPAS